MCLTLSHNWSTSKSIKENDDDDDDDDDDTRRTPT